MRIQFTNQKLIIYALPGVSVGVLLMTGGCIKGSC